MRVEGTLMQSSPRKPLTYALGLKALGLLAFPLIAVLAAILQRSFLLLVLLAAAMACVGFIQRRQMLKAAGQQQIVNPGRFIAGIGARLGALLGLFVLTLGVLALFRDTSLARSLNGLDAALVLFPTLLTLGADMFLAHTVNREMESVRTSVHSETHRANPNAQGPIIEGEIIPPKD